MRFVILLLVASLVASTGAHAQTSETTFTLLAQLRDGEYVWVDDDEVNPRLRVPPGAEATIFIQQGETSGSVPHDIQVGGGSTSDRIVAPGETANVTFTAPPSGTVPYVCTVHPSTMHGEIEVTEATRESTGDDGVPAPATALVVALLAGLALARRRRAK